MEQGLQEHNGYWGQWGHSSDPAHHPAPFVRSMWPAPACASHVSRHRAPLAPRASRRASSCTLHPPSPKPRWSFWFPSRPVGKMQGAAKLSPPPPPSPYSWPPGLLRGLRMSHQPLLPTFAFSAEMGERSTSTTPGSDPDSCPRLMAHKLAVTVTPARTCPPPRC